MLDEMTEDERQAVNHAIDAKILADRAGEAEILAEAQRLAEAEAERAAKWQELISVPHAMVDGVPIPLTADEIKQMEKDAIAAAEFKRVAGINLIREERNKLLAESDWTQLPDTGLSDEKKLAWRNYRQNLRDLMDGLDDPAAVVWPERPD